MNTAQTMRAIAMLAALLSPITAMSQIRAAFVYVGPAGEVGWSHSHDQGRQYLERKYGDDIRTEYVEFVEEGRASTDVIRRLAQQNDIVFTTSWGFMVPTSRVAKEQPDVKFDNATGLRIENNLGSFAARAYEPRYLSGMIAGAMSKTNRIGFVAAHPIPEVIRGINAFTLGVKRTNPNATVHVKWTRQWYAPEKATQLAEQLVQDGVDVLTHHTDSPAVMTVAEKAGIYGISFHSDMSEFAPSQQLASVGYDWGPYYASRIEALREGNWQGDRQWLGMKEHIARLTSVSQKIPAEIRRQVNEVQAGIEQQSFDVFSGPLTSSHGRKLVNAGESLTDFELERMNWYVAGVVGDLPSF